MQINRIPTVMVYSYFYFEINLRNLEEKTWTFLSFESQKRARINSEILKLISEIF